MRLMAMPWDLCDLPMVHQIESAECGLACLAMISGFHRKPIELRELRERFSLSTKGVTLRALMHCAESLGFNCRAVRVGLETMQELATPCILHWGMNHYVVLKRVRGGRIEIHDPAGGKRVLSMIEANTRFTGVALELEPKIKIAHATTSASRYSLSSLMGPVVGLRSHIAAVVILALAAEALGLALPLFMQIAVDNVAGLRDLSIVWALGAAFGAIAIANIAAKSLQNWATSLLGLNISVEWTRRLFSHLIRLPLQWFQSRQLGEVINRFASIGGIQRALTTDSVRVAFDGLLSTAALTVMFHYHVGLSLIAVAGVISCLLIKAAFHRSFRRLTEEEISFQGRKQTDLLETLRGIQAVRLAGKGEQRRRSFDNALIEQNNATIAITKLSLMCSSIVSAVQNAERMLTVTLACIFAICGEMSLGMMIAFLAYREMFANRLVAAIDQVFAFRLLRVQADRIADIALTPAVTESSNVTAEVKNGGIDVEIRGVSFAYSALEPPVIDDFWLTVKAGEFVAVAGPSGGGKSTLLKLILGALTPTSGVILVGGSDAPVCNTAGLRDLVACVMQDDNLFSGSIADNITFFDAEIDKPAMWKAAQTASLHDEIMAMPMGYQTLISDSGTGLSGGQRQRLLLARALYRSPRLLLLDEATSHLDLQNEHAINEALRAMRITRIIAAHRPETLRAADRIIHLST